MKAADYFRETLQLPIASRTDITGSEPFVVLSPHPDDETLGLGGLIRQACTAGQQVDVVVLTDGSGSHPRSLAYPAPQLIELRKTEVLDAAAMLGLPSEHIHHLDLRDTEAPTSGPSFDAAVSDLVSIIKTRGARTLFTTWSHDPHCDHAAAASIAEAAVTMTPGVKLWAYPIWGWHLDTECEVPGSPRGYRIDIAGEQTTKRRAIFAHRSQMTDLISDDPEGFRFTDKTLAPFLGACEYIYDVAAS